MELPAPTVLVFPYMYSTIMSIYDPTSSTSSFDAFFVVLLNYPTGRLHERAPLVLINYSKVYRSTRFEVDLALNESKSAPIVTNAVIILCSTHSSVGFA